MTMTLGKLKKMFEGFSDDTVIYILGINSARDNVCSISSFHGEHYSNGILLIDTFTCEVIRDSRVINLENYKKMRGKA